MKYKYLIVFVLLFGVATLTQAYADEFPIVVEAGVRAVVSAERAGVLSNLKVDAGDAVKKGDVLAVVFHEDLILKRQQREANKEYRDVQVENLNKLNEKGLVTDEELAKAKMEAVVNNKEITMIQTEIDRSKIRAPFSGLVVMRHAQPHEWVTPGKNVVEVYDPGSLRMAADIPSEIAVSLKPGRVETLFFQDLKQEVKAKFRVLSPQVDVRSNTIKAYWTVEGGELRKVRLLPGMKGVLKLGSDSN